MLFIQFMKDHRYQSRLPCQQTHHFYLIEKEKLPVVKTDLIKKEAMNLIDSKEECMRRFEERKRRGPWYTQINLEK